MMSKTVTVILNGYKRNNLREQVAAINRQTYQPEEIFYWQNTVPGFHYDEDTYCQLNAALSNYNYGVWARFAFALNARTDYVCILDDDTIPGDRWIENNVKTYETHPGLLGGIGLRFTNGNYDLDVDENGKLWRVGWDGTYPNFRGNNTKVEQVDIVGHSWFFARDLLSVFWREIPDNRWTMLCGEDMHFSYMLQKYTDLKTWVPPQLPNDSSTWASLKGWQYGGDHLATANTTCQTGEMKKYLTYCIDNGFKLIRDM